MLTQTVKADQTTVPPAPCTTCGGLRYLEGEPNYTPCPDCCVCPTCDGLLDRTPDQGGCLCSLADERATRHASRQQ